MQQALVATVGGTKHQIDEMTFHITGVTATESLSLNATAIAALGSGVWSYDAGTGVLAVAATDLPDANWTTILDNVVYLNTNSPDATRTILVTATDSGDYQAYYLALGTIPPIVEPAVYDITGTDNADFEQGGAGNQSINALGGDDTIFGDDQSPAAGDGDDLINAGDGNDQVEAGGANDQIIGGLGDDRIVGDYQSVSAFDGDDVIHGNGGNDTLEGCAGDDAISGGDDDDTIRGDYDFETTGGADVLNGNAGIDTIKGGAGNDEVVGGTGNDILYGDYSFATGSDGSDVIVGGIGDDEIHGGGGTDIVVFAGARSEYTVVENGDGSFTVTDGIGGRDGVDTVFETETFRFSDADYDASVVVSGTGGTGGGTTEQATATLVINITGVNEAPDDIAFAGGPLPEDTAIGTLVGTAAGDDPDGDTLAYSLLDDAGGLFAIDAVTGAVTLAGALDYETATSHTIEIQIEDPSGEIYSESFVIGVTDVVDETVTLTPDDDVYQVPTSTDNLTLYALEGNDLIQTGAGNDHIYGQLGRDELRGGDGDDELFGGGGRDDLIGGHGADTMAGGVGNDVYRIDDLDDVVVEDAGEGLDRVASNLTLTLGAHVEALNLLGSDNLDGTGNELDNRMIGNYGDNVLSGLAGADRLRGDLGDDTLLGGDGNDVLGGEVGRDTLTGGAGLDQFVFGDADLTSDRALADMVTDFSQADGDRLKLKPMDANTGQLGDQRFFFIGAQGFTGVAGQLHYVQDSGNTYVEGDTDGDGAADFVIGLAGTLDLNITDFVL